jgi:type IV pilus assembly protein PilA
MRNTHGFTLIELMIVIAILGILMAIAIPAYQDYTVRARVSEGLMTAAAAKLAVSETRASEARWPNSNSQAGSYKTVHTTYVSSVGILTGGVIEVLYSGNSKLAGAANTKLVLTPTFNGSIQWSCNGNAGFGTVGSIPPKYVPANCR